MSTRARDLLLLVALVLLFACDDPTEPRDPVWNKQDCAHCHMLLSDPRYAAQAVRKDGRRVYFDDVGCLLLAMRDPQRPIERAWVHSEGAWRDVEHARFSTGATTPMGFGFVADAHGALDFPSVSDAVAARSARGEP